MINELKKYPTYKDSGVPWFGEVPEHWEVRRLRNVARMLVSNVDKLTEADEISVRLCNYVDVYKNDRITDKLLFMHATATTDEVEHFHLQIGDVVITKDSETWNDIGIPALVEYSASDLVCGYHLAIIRSHAPTLLGDYLLRAFQSRGVALQFYIAANGVTRYGLSQDAIKSILLMIPPLAEQSSIVGFLDHADRRIKRCILAKQKMIKLLEEQKRAIIYQAVTRGLNPNVRFKSSGVKWLGDVPEHWDVQRNGRLFIQRNETGHAGLPILEVSLKTGVRVRDLVNGNRKQVMSDHDKYKRAVAGDIAYNMMRMWQGAIGIAPVDGLVSPAYVVARPIGDLVTTYYESLFRTAAYMREVNNCSRGIVQDRNRLYWEEFKQIFSPVPPLVEQRQIVQTLLQKTKRIDGVILKARTTISLLREYRTRLIADVVTGKLDVREAAKNLPEEIGETGIPEEVNVSVEGDSGDEEREVVEPEEVEA